MLVSVSVEPKFAKKQILVCATGELEEETASTRTFCAPYKPVTFTSESTMWKCLQDLGITELKEFGNPVEWLDGVDTKILERWGFVRTPLTRTKKEAKVFFADVLSSCLDHDLFSVGFKRNANSLKYSRNYERSKQLISFDFKNMQNYEPGEIWLTVTVHLMELENTARCFLKVSDEYVRTRSTFRWEWKKNCPSEFADPLEFYDRTSLEPSIKKIHDCLKNYLIPILDHFRSAEKFDQRLRKRSRFLTSKRRRECY